MKVILWIAALIGSMHSYSQGNQENLTNAKNTIVKSCDLNPFVVDDGKLGIKYLGKESVEQFFNRKLNPTTVASIKGEILLQALIDTKGKICCKQISSPTGIPDHLIKELHLDYLIAKMDKWKPAIINGKKWNSSILLSLLFKGTRSVIVHSKQLSAI